MIILFFCVVAGKLIFRQKNFIVVFINYVSTRIELNENGKKLLIIEIDDIYNV